MQPAVVVEHGDGCFRSVEITPHHLWTTDPQLAAFFRTNLASAFRGDDPGLRVRQQLSHRAGDRLFRTGRTQVRHGAGLSQPVALLDLASDALPARLLQLRAERSPSGHDDTQPREVVLGNDRLFGEG